MVDDQGEVAQKPTTKQIVGQALRESTKKAPKSSLLKALKIKVLLIILGVAFVALGGLGYYLIDYCSLAPEELTSQVVDVVSEPLTMGGVAVLGTVLQGVGEFFVSVLCPVLSFLNSLLPLFWYIVAGAIMAFVGWILP